MLCSVTSGVFFPRRLAITKAAMDKARSANIPATIPRISPKAPELDVSPFALLHASPSDGGSTWGKRTLKPIDATARCRCSTKDSSRGLSVCQTNDDVCTAQSGCAGGGGASCSCKPSEGMKRIITHEHCLTECERIGMWIMMSDEDCLAAHATGCGFNSAPVWACT